MKNTRIFACAIALAATSAYSAEPPAQASANRGALDRYQKFEDAPANNWLQANDTVAKVGGWRVYARERMQAPAKSDAGTQGASTMPAHHGHGAAK